MKNYPPVLILALLLGGCGSGAISGPEEQTTTSQASTNTTTSADVTTTGPATDGTTTTTSTTTTTVQQTTTTTTKRRYGWNPPSGAGTPTITESSAYGILLRGDCAEAQDFLDKYWQTFVSARNVLIFQAGTHLCAGREPAARQMYERAKPYGFVMEAAVSPDCFAYRAVRSVMDQVPLDAITCQVGADPVWPNAGSQDDPRTDIVEGIPTT